MAQHQSDVEVSDHKISFNFEGCWLRGGRWWWLDFRQVGAKCKPFITAGLQLLFIYHWKLQLEQEGRKGQEKRRPRNRNIPQLLMNPKRRHHPGYVLIGRTQGVKVACPSWKIYSLRPSFSLCLSLSLSASLSYIPTQPRKVGGPFFLSITTGSLCVYANWRKVLRGAERTQGPDIQFHPCYFFSFFIFFFLLLLLLLQEVIDINNLL